MSKILVIPFFRQGISSTQTLIQYIDVSPANTYVLIRTGDLYLSDGIKWNLVYISVPNYVFYDIVNQALYEVGLTVNKITSFSKNEYILLYENTTLIKILQNINGCLVTITDNPTQINFVSTNGEMTPYNYQNPSEGQQWTNGQNGDSYIYQNGVWIKLATIDPNYLFQVEGQDQNGNTTSGPIHMVSKSKLIFRSVQGLNLEVKQGSVIADIGTIINLTQYGGTFNEYLKNTKNPSKDGFFLNTIDNSLYIIDGAKIVEIITTENIGNFVNTTSTGYPAFIGRYTIYPGNNVPFNYTVPDGANVVLVSMCGGGGNGGNGDARGSGGDGGGSSGSVKNYPVPVISGSVIKGSIGNTNNVSTISFNTNFNIRCNPGLNGANNPNGGSIIIFNPTSTINGGSFGNTSNGSDGNWKTYIYSGAGGGSRQGRFGSVAGYNGGNVLMYLGGKGGQGGVGGGGGGGGGGASAFANGGNGGNGGINSNSNGLPGLSGSYGSGGGGGGGSGGNRGTIGGIGGQGGPGYLELIFLKY